MSQADSTVIFGEEIINCCHTVLNGSELSITEAWDILTVQDKMKKKDLSCSTFTSVRFLTNKINMTII